MEITEVKVFPVSEEKLKAFVSVVFDRCFMVNDIKIIHGRQGLFISMPSRKKKNGEFKDVAHPLNNETRRMIEDQILAEYDRVLEERGMSPGIAARPRVERATDMAAAPAVAPSPVSEAPGPVAEPAAEPAAEQVALRDPHEDQAAASDKTLEEVQEMHLRDSFWTVP